MRFDGGEASYRRRVFGGREDVWRLRVGVPLCDEPRLRIGNLLGLVCAEIEAGDGDRRIGHPVRARSILLRPLLLQVAHGDQRVYCFGTLNVRSYGAWSRKVLTFGYQLSRASTVKLPPPALCTTLSPAYSIRNSCALPFAIASGITT